MKDLNKTGSRETKLVRSRGTVLSSFRAVACIMADSACNRSSVLIITFFKLNIPLGWIFDRKITGLVPTV